MNRHTVRNSALALLGLASLLIYVLACTSFSPDDKKVVYPTIDSRSGQVGVAVYDRESRRSELIFVPHLRVGADVTADPALLRPQWLSDGKGIVVAWPGREGTADDKDGLTIAVLPLGTHGPVRLFQLPDLKETAPTLALPLPLAGQWLFVHGKSNTVLRLDLTTGAVKCQAWESEVILYASPVPGRVGYTTKNDGDKAVEVGLFNPETFARTSILHVSGDEFAGDQALLALSPDGRKAAFVTENGGEPQVHFREEGAPTKTSPRLAKTDERLSLGSAQFSPKGDLLYASFVVEGEQRTNAAYGFLEVPADGSPVRRTTLINRGPPDDDMAMFFQIGVSHDGKALAVASTYLAFAEEGLAADDCALFLVDLTDPQRKVTKVPIPRPAEAESKAAK